MYGSPTRGSFGTELPKTSVRMAELKMPGRLLGRNAIVYSSRRGLSLPRLSTTVKLTLNRPCPAPRSPR